MTKRAVEQTGLIPRSIIRTFERFKKQLFPGAEMLVIQEFRVSRYQVIVSVKSLLTLIFVPLLVNIISKNFFITPLVEYVWNTHHPEIFLNTGQQNAAIRELNRFEEKLYFESLLEHPNLTSDIFDDEIEVYTITTSKETFTLYFPKVQDGVYRPRRSVEREEKIQNKTLEIASTYNKESIEAISNLLADFCSFLSLTLVFTFMKPQLIILKSFLAESLYSLSDTTKSFLLILSTDLLVGFHSPRGWEVFLEWVFLHFGLPENSEFMSLFVATFPVFLDTVFKYWIFRSLNKISPSTVATYHNMIE